MALGEIQSTQRGIRKSADGSVWICIYQFLKQFFRGWGFKLTQYRDGAPDSQYILDFWIFVNPAIYLRLPHARRQPSKMHGIDQHLTI